MQKSEYRSVGKAARCVLASVLGLAFGTTAVLAQESDVIKASTFVDGQLYQRVPLAAENEAQVIYFRKGNIPKEDGAHIYVDSEFHTALLPYSYTRVCLRPGSHSLETYVGDAPVYEGKSNPKTTVQLQGGKTYFVAVGTTNGEPTPMQRAEAEHFLRDTNEQVHLLGRASAVIPCQGTIPAPEETVTPAASGSGEKWPCDCDKDKEKSLENRRKSAR